MSLWLKQSTAVTVKIGPFIDDTDFKTAETALTISQADIRLSKNGGAFAQSNNAAGATHDASGYYGIPLDTTDTNTLGTLRVFVAETGALHVWQDFMVVTANIWDSLFGADKLQVDVAEWLGTAAATPTVAGVPEVDVTHLNGVAQSLQDLKDFADDGYDPTTNKVQGVVLTDTVTTYTGNTPQTGDAFARLGAPVGASISADVAAVKGDTVDIEADTQDIQARLPAALTGAGNIKADALVVSDKTGYALTAGERTSVADALLDRDMATGTDSGSTTVRTVRQALRFLRNKWSISGTTLTVTKENDTDASWTSTLTTSASAEPVTASDPAGP